MTAQQSIREIRAITKRVSTSTTIALWVCLGATIALFVASFLTPPKWVIDATIFKAAGFMFAFATLFEVREAIREGLGIKLTHGETMVEIHDIDREPSETKNDEQ